MNESSRRAALTLLLSCVCLGGIAWLSPSMQQRRIDEQLLFDDPRWVRGSAPIPLIELAQRRIGRTCVWRAARLNGRRAESRILVSEFFETGLLGEQAAG